MRLDDQEQLIRDLEGTLQHAAMETDRKLTTQQQEYEKKMQILLRQLTEGKDDATSDTRSEVTHNRASLVFILSDVTRFVEFSSRLVHKVVRLILDQMGF